MIELTDVNGEIVSQYFRVPISRRIYRMNRRMEQEIGENIIEKHGHEWKLIPRLRRDLAAARR